MSRFCVNCGAEISENAKFCTGCGSKVENKVNKVPKNKTMVMAYNDDRDGGVDDYILTTLTPYTGGGFVRISLVLKDNEALTADDIANLKITLK